MTGKTTFRSVDAKAAAILAKLPADDPVVRANLLCDQAVALQDAGDCATAALLLAQAEQLLGTVAS